MKKGFWEADYYPIAIAHRGGDAAGKSKENTLEAFAAAKDMGYEYGETDVVLTADGHVIAVHGTKNRLLSLLKKGVPARPLLQSLALEDIQRRFSVDGERIPLLEEVLESQPDMKFFIDAKTEEVVEPLVQLLEKMKVLGRVSVGSFSYERLERMTDLLGHQTAAHLIIDRSVGTKNKNLQLLASGRANNFDSTHLRHTLVTPQVIKLHHDQGVKALIWTCNSAALIGKAIDSGADGVISDNLQLLSELTRPHGSES